MSYKFYPYLGGYLLQYSPYFLIVSNDQRDPDKQMVSLWVPSELKSEIAALAAEEGRNMSGMVERIIRQHLTKRGLDKDRPTARKA